MHRLIYFLFFFNFELLFNFLQRPIVSVYYLFLFVNIIFFLIIIQANDEVFFQKDGLRFFRSGDLGRIVENKVRTYVLTHRTYTSHLQI